MTLAVPSREDSSRRRVVVLILVLAFVCALASRPLCAPRKVNAASSVAGQVVAYIVSAENDTGLWHVVMQRDANGPIDRTTAEPRSTIAVTRKTRRWGRSLSRSATDFCWSPPNTPAHIRRWCTCARAGSSFTSSARRREQYGCAPRGDRFIVASGARWIVRTGSHAAHVACPMDA